MATKKAKKKQGTYGARVAEYVRSSLMRQRVRFENALSCVIDGNYGIYRARVVMGRKKIKSLSQNLRHFENDVSDSEM